MTPRMHNIIMRAMEEAFAMQVINLVEVLNSDTSDEGIARFERGLKKSVDLHEQLVAQLKPPCTAPGSSG